MLKIITAVFTVLTLLLLFVTGLTLWGTLAFVLAAAALVCVCFAAYIMYSHRKQEREQ